MASIPHQYWDLNKITFSASSRLGKEAVREELVKYHQNNSWLGTLLYAYWFWLQTSAILKVLIKDQWPKDVCGISFSPASSEVLSFSSSTSSKTVSEWSCSEPSSSCFSLPGLRSRYTVPGLSSWNTYGSLVWPLRVSIRLLFSISANEPLHYLFLPPITLCLP